MKTWLLIAFCLGIFVAKAQDQRDIHKGKIKIRKANDQFATSSIEPILVSTQDFIVPESQPIFPEGEAKMLNYISSNLKFPQDSNCLNKTGTVYVSFMVDTLGTICNTKVIRGVCQAYDKEALRVVSSMPKWTPGTMSGKKVNMQYTIPIKFSLK